MYKMSNVPVYLMADDTVSCVGDALCVADIYQVYSVHKEIQTFIQQCPLTGLRMDGGDRVFLSVMDTIADLSEMISRRYPESTVQFVNLGAQQVVIKREQHRKSAMTRLWTLLKVVIAGAIVFIGSAFTIMTYNQDVDVTGVFARIYQMITGETSAQPGLLELGYAVGLAVGLLMFFNPLIASKKRREPSPIEIEMEKYESDILDTLKKMQQRK